MIQGDANPFHEEDTNYADAKYYKSADFGICQVPLDPDGGNHEEKPKAATLP